MAKKRYTDAEKHKRSWFRKLPPRLKVAEDILTCECDEIGVWTIDLEALEFKIGEAVTLAELQEHFKVEVLSEDELWIPGFVELQVGEKETGRLSPDAPYHRDLAEKLMRRGLPVPEFNPSKKPTPASEAFLSSLAAYRPSPAWAPNSPPIHPVSEGGTTPPTTRDGGGVESGSPVKEKANGEEKESSELCESSENYVFPTETSAENPLLPIDEEFYQTASDELLLQLADGRGGKDSSPRAVREVIRRGIGIPDNAMELERKAIEATIHQGLGVDIAADGEIHVHDPRAGFSSARAPVLADPPAPEVLPAVSTPASPPAKKGSKAGKKPKLDFNPVWIWCELFRQRYGFSPEILKEDAGRLTNFGNGRSEEKVRTFFACYFAIKKPLYVEAKHPVGLFFRDMQLVNAAVQTGQDPMNPKSDYSFLEKEVRK